MKISPLAFVPQCTPQVVFRASTLALAVSTLIMTTTTQAAISYDESGNATYSTIGDLSIYQPPVGESQPTVMLMLDKSGSMDEDSLWDDYGKLDYKYDPFTRVENRTFVRGDWEWECNRRGRNCRWVDRRYTVTEPTDITYNYQTSNLKGMNDEPCYFGDNSTASSNYISQSRDDDGYDYEINYCIDTSVEDTRTASEIAASDVPTNWRLDRISALKIAVFKLLRNPKMDENINVGVGSYGHESRYGKIGVAAKALNDSQKDKLRDYVADLDASGGTPTARAFAEAGAYVLGNNTYAGTSTYSGFRNISVDGVIRNSSNYIKPESSQCAGTGIYLLTDGEPNNGNEYTQTMMRPSLDSSSFQCSGLMSNSGAAYSSARWDCIGDYARTLENDKGVKTAMVGFGSSFNVFNDASNYRTVQATLSDGTPYEKKYYRCDLLTDTDAKNSCNLGMETEDEDTGFSGFAGVGGFGEGGFYYAKDSKDIVNSVLSFVTKLDNDLASIPSGTITIPRDPLSSQNIQPYAYLPMLEPKVGTNLMVWPGNLKKYQVDQGTLFGRSTSGSNVNTRLYVSMDKDGNIDTTGKKFPADLNPNVRDLWSTKNYQDVNEAGNTVNVNDRITSGGFYAKLKSPTDDNNTTRAVYVENGAGLTKLAVTSGSLVGFGDLDSSYGAEEKLYLLSFLGYNINVDAALIEKVKNATNPETELAKLITSPSGEVKVLGGVLHSQPTVVSYGGKINSPEKDANNDDVIDADAGQVSTDASDRNDYVMFGSMEGALHLAKSENGKEALAFIPKKIITNQAKALKEAAVSLDPNQQTPVFGVDAPWTARGLYDYKFETDGSGRVSANRMNIYGGLSRGGVGLYGLNVSTIATPTKLFAIDDTTTGYSRLGMTMAQPVFGKIKIGTGRNAIKEVIIFGGGYDKCYEDPTFKLNATDNNLDSCNNIAQAKGNAVYIADAKTGALIASISGATTGSKNISVPTMKHSIVSEITTLDRDNDGLIDHLYFGDLGGQLYRVDLQNSQSLSTTAGLNTFVRRVTRVLNTSGDTTSDTQSKALLNKGLQYRFYAQPSVSFFLPEGANGERIAVVNIASGDRSSPLSRHRNNLTEANRLFGIIDRDIVDQNLYGDALTLSASELTLDKLALLPFDQVTIPATPTTPGAPAPAPTTSTKANVINAIQRGVFQGWSYPLTYFDAYANIKHVKSMGNGLAMGGIYYLTAYSPEMQYDTTVNTCSAQVVGGSERQLYCLPWGICEESTSKNGIGGFVRAGKGIQELALGSFSADFTNVQVLIGNQTFSEQLNFDNRSGFGNRSFSDTTPGIVRHSFNGSGKLSDVNGLGTAGIFANMNGYQLYPQRWYEKSVD
ncbi:PilC/PilY family type IV pilus protein [uncultured Psychrobacter sp.]|uniref:PilC/PilY family type IV pilus protein n=1 Tax=uncultured Psychrobacter sp. TaxID=259303 RepID=UPI002615F2B2|nr:PilC/PilY family type IV pilus protein [uncultured Psychrobacter sp.]